MRLTDHDRETIRKEIYRLVEEKKQFNAEVDSKILALRGQLEICDGPLKEIGIGPELARRLARADFHQLPITTIGDFLSNLLVEADHYQRGGIARLASTSGLGEKRFAQVLTKLQERGCISKEEQDLYVKAFQTEENRIKKGRP